MPDIRLPTASRRRRALSLPSLLVGGLLASVVTYFADPDRGRGRRAQARDRLAGQFRRVGRHGVRTTRHLAATANGKLRMAARSHEAHEIPNDADLAAKVKTKLFRDPTVPKGHISLNAEHGVVVVRGVVPSIEDHDRIVAQIRRIEDVIDVRTLLRVADELDVDRQRTDHREWLDLRDTSFR